MTRTYWSDQNTEGSQKGKLLILKAEKEVMSFLNGLDNKKSLCSQNLLCKYLKTVAHCGRQ